MIEFRESSDPKSIDILRDGHRIGYVQWHSESRIVLVHPFAYLTFDEIRLCERHWRSRTEKGYPLNPEL